MRRGSGDLRFIFKSQMTEHLDYVLAECKEFTPLMRRMPLRTKLTVGKWCSIKL